ncbi:hypothetical protein MP228_002121 [Amoeboaphelidium protococcarum]|nr:hypothetical protein MP228_002121 [Amoeboaphelidium protococcarum]
MKCKVCKSKRFNLTDLGFYVCANGHAQEQMVDTRADEFIQTGVGRELSKNQRLSQSSSSKKKDKKNSKSDGSKRSGSVSADGEDSTTDYYDTEDSEGSQKKLQMSPLMKRIVDTYDGRKLNLFEVSGTLFLQSIFYEQCKWLVDAALVSDDFMEIAKRFWLQHCQSRESSVQSKQFNSSTIQDRDLLLLLFHACQHSQKTRIVVLNDIVSLCSLGRIQYDHRQVQAPKNQQFLPFLDVYQRVPTQIFSMFKLQFTFDDPGTPSLLSLRFTSRIHSIGGFRFIQDKRLCFRVLVKRLLLPEGFVSLCCKLYQAMYIEGRGEQYKGNILSPLYFEMRIAVCILITAKFCWGDGVREGQMYEIRKEIPRIWTRCKYRPTQDGYSCWKHWFKQIYALEKERLFTQAGGVMKNDLNDMPSLQNSHRQLKRESMDKAWSQQKSVGSYDEFVEHFPPSVGHNQKGRPSNTVFEDYYQDCIIAQMKNKDRSEYLKQKSAYMCHSVYKDFFQVQLTDRGFFRTHNVNQPMMKQGVLKRFQITPFEDVNTEYTSQEKLENLKATDYLKQIDDTNELHDDQLDQSDVKLMRNAVPSLIARLSVIMGYSAFDIYESLLSMEGRIDLDYVRIFVDKNRESYLEQRNAKRAGGSAFSQNQDEDQEDDVEDEMNDGDQDQ